MCLPRNLSGETIQLIAATIGSLQFFNFGLMFGITPFSVKLYQSETETPLKDVDIDATTWLSGYLFLGVAVGSIIFGVLTNKIGPKVVLQISGLLQLTSWFCIHFGSHIQHIQASRAFNGAGFGAAFIVLPIFITEITKSPSITARYIAFTELWRSFGVLLGFAFSIYLPNVLVALIGIGVSIASALLFPFVQESPYYLRSEGNVNAMEKSLRWYRGVRHVDDHGKPEFVHEVTKFKNEMEESQPIVTMSLPCAYAFKLGLYCFVLIVCVQLSGVYFIFNYAFDLYTDHNVALLFGGVQVLGAILAICFGAKLNRKIILTLTGLVCGFSLIFLVVADKWQIVSTQKALTLSMAFLSLHIFSASIGLQPIASIVTQELLPFKLRLTYTTIVSTMSWIFLFGVIQSYQYVSAYNLTIYFGIFAGACFLAAIVAFAFLPDTKAKSTEEIQRDMGFAVIENIARLSTINGGQIHENTYI